jgi:hypothetical protein
MLGAHGAADASTLLRCIRVVGARDGPSSAGVVEGKVRHDQPRAEDVLDDLRRNDARAVDVVGAHNGEVAAQGLDGRLDDAGQEDIGVTTGIAVVSADGRDVEAGVIPVGVVSRRVAAGSAALPKVAG